MFAINHSIVTIETLPALRVACLRAASTSPEEDGWRQMNCWIAAQGLKPGGRKFGFDVEVTAVEQKAGYRGYEVWETVPDSVRAMRASEGVFIQNFPGGLYAVMTLERCFEDPFERIPRSWKELHTWVIQNEGYQSAGHQWLEETLTVEYGQTLKLYHPVMHKP